MASKTSRAKKPAVTREHETLYSSDSDAIFGLTGIADYLVFKNHYHRTEEEQTLFPSTVGSTICFRDKARTGDEEFPYNTLTDAQRTFCASYHIAESYEYYLLEYDQSTLKHCVRHFNNRDLVREIEFSPNLKVSFRSIVVTDSTIICWGISDYNETYEIWAGALEGDSLECIAAGGFGTRRGMAIAAHKNEAFISDRGKILRASTDTPNELTEVCSTFGAVNSMAVADGMLYCTGQIGEVDDEVVWGLLVVDLESGSVVRTVPLDGRREHDVVGVFSSGVFVKRGTIKRFDDNGSRIEMSHIVQIHDDDTVEIVAAPDDADIDSFYADGEALYWIDNSPSATSLVDSGGNIWKHNYTSGLHRRALEDRAAKPKGKSKKRRKKVALKVAEAQVSDREREYTADAEARLEAYRESFGPLEEQLLMLMNYRLNCPGMAIVHARPEKLPFPEVYLTYGLAGVQAGTGLAETNIKHKVNPKTGDACWESTIATGTKVGGGSYAGYGLEFIAATRSGGKWLDLTLAWLTEQQIYGEFDFFGAILSEGAVLSGPYTGSLGLLGEPTNYLVSPTWGPLPSEYSLGHGKIRLMCLVNVDDAEVKFAYKHGPKALRNHLIASNIMPMIDPGRKSNVW